MEKIKLFLVSDKGKDLMVVFIVILVGIASFGLGRLSNKDPDSGLKIEYPTSMSGASVNALPGPKNEPKTLFEGEKSFFASSRGSKYYPANCEAGKSIKMENRVYFTSADEAEQAGYTKSSSCR
jgi:hypothetical protein